MLHLLAIAREAGVELTLDDFDTIASRTPIVVDIKPAGRFVATDLYRAGGVALVARELVGAGVVHGDARTRRRPFARARSAAGASERPGQEVVVPLGRAAEADRRARRSCAARSPPTAAS